MKMIISRPKKERIAMDLDGTLVDFVTPTIKYINEEFGTTLKPEDVTTYDFESSPNIKAQIPFSGWFGPYYNYLVEKGVYRELKLLPYAREAIKELKSLDKDLVVITQRNSALGYLEEDTLTFIEEKFPRCFSDVYFVPEGIRKVEICWFRLRCTGLVEDYLKALLEARRYLKKSVLVNQPYNQTIESRQNGVNGLSKENGIYRIKDLRYLKEAFESD